MSLNHAVLFFTLLVSHPAAWAEIKTSISNTFLQCLYKNSLPSHPISQAIYTPQNTSYINALDIYARNLRFTKPNTPKPLVIVAAMHESHVRAAITCSNQTNVLLRTRSGGHDYEGISYTANIPFVILDMSNLRSVDINLADDTAWVESGAILGELYYRIAEKSSTRAFPAGVCPTVGVSGHFSGGGYGTLIRKYGLSVDNIVDAKIMGLDGIVKDRKAMGEDLFWAIRGGGGASFGVILSWKIKLVVVPETVTVFVVDKTTDQGLVDLAYKYQNVVTKLPDDLFLRMELSAIGGYQKTIKAAFIGIFLGKTEGLLEVMKKHFPELELNQHYCTEMKWIESVLYWNGIPTGTSIDVLLDRSWYKNTYTKSKSDFIKNTISKQGLECILEKLVELGDIIMQWNPYGGRMNEISEYAVPLPQRSGYLFKIQHILYWNQSRESHAEHYMNESRQFYDFMTPYATSSPREAFQNYRDLDIGHNPYCNASYAQAAKTYGVKYFKRNFERLVKIKTTVDPTNFFRNEQSIPTLPM
ncbi:berberine bridge enzyme-like 8 [Heracleum sosnowskyi]|uniref:Berberine bridge enzyme-like 8 n=1 Tax=Heracleum sosnowskyi TaxID=360622 RepID=A0AAD8MPR3_9APIA|nr:berberine bridge enzyme-like 8 [Heracleum sosnowskyi]